LAGSRSAAAGQRSASGFSGVSSVLPIRDRATGARPLQKPAAARAGCPRSWQSSSAGVSRPTPSRPAPPPAEVAVRRRSARADSHTPAGRSDRPMPLRRRVLLDGM
jgi:hypothetical protein